MDRPLIDLQDADKQDLTSKAKDKDDKPVTTTEVNSSEKMDAPAPGGSQSTGRSEKKSAGIWPWSKRDRFQRNPSLDKVDEDAEQTPSQSDEMKSCPDYFGVRSYLHHFYETRSYKDPDLYEESSEDTRRLLDPSSRRGHRHCGSIWWKAFVLLGACLLVVGIAAVLIGYIVPQKPILVGLIDGGDKEKIDRDAIEYNFRLDVCKLTGLILFCTGGMTLAVALMVPSFLYRYCSDEERRAEPGFAVHDGRDAPPLATKDPLKMSIPSTSRVTEIQPARKKDESILVSETMIPYQEYE